MITLEATLVDVEICFKNDDGMPFKTTVGVLKDTWNDAYLDTRLDKSVYFWFDNLDEIFVGSEVDGETTISAILTEPYEQREVLTNVNQ